MTLTPTIGCLTGQPVPHPLPGGHILKTGSPERFTLRGDGSQQPSTFTYQGANRGSASGVPCPCSLVRCAKGQFLPPLKREGFLGFRTRKVFVVSRTVLLKPTAKGFVFMLKPSGDPALCAVCGYPLGQSEEEACKSCDVELCDDCFRHEPYCSDCPSEPEEHGSDWWRALLEAGDAGV